MAVGIRLVALTLCFSFCLDTKRNKKIKAKGMLPRTLLILNTFSLPGA
jgi:hypothetical protein